jgi:hypothetical protein
MRDQINNLSTTATVTATIVLLVCLVGCRSSEASNGVDVQTAATKSQVMYGEPVSGLQVGLSYEGYDACGGPQLLVHLRNAGDKPITVVAPHSLRGREPAFDLLKNGQRVPREDDSAYVSTMDFSFSAIVRDAVSHTVSIAPGETVTERGSFNPWLERNERSATVSVAYVYENPWQELWVPLYEDFGRRSPLGRVGPLWTGSARSEFIEFAVSERRGK